MALRRERFECVCGVTFYDTPYNKKSHNVTKKHVTFIEAPSEESKLESFKEWFYSIYKQTDIKTDILKIKDIYPLYRSSDIYKNLNKVEKRINNRIMLIESIKNIKELKKCYIDRCSINKKSLRNIITNHCTIY